jgi:hypothetical protein
VDDLLAVHVAVTALDLVLDAERDR